jgi:uncharacterized YokU family protein
MECEWCSSTKIVSKTESVFWELPDGSRAIEITETPTVICNDCLMTYQSERVVKEIEDQLFLIDSKIVGKVISFNELLKMPRLLKKNYFDFTS